MQTVYDLNYSVCCKHFCFCGECVDFIDNQSK